MENLRKRTMGGSGSSLPLGAMADGSNAVATDILFSSNDGEQLCIIHDQENWPDEGWTPIGIVVVPGTHNRYGDGSCGIMSLVGMYSNNPETGIPLIYSSEKDDDTIIWSKEREYTVDNDIFSSNMALTSVTNYIPCNYYNSGEIFADSRALVWPYAGTTTAPTSGASTAYTNTGGYVTATSGKAGCDFNGIRNTAALYVKTRTNMQWTASNVRLYGVETPAVACAGRFKTVGTKSFVDVYGDITSNDLSYGTPTSTKDNKGFWYLPALGELCYLPSKRFLIENTILALNQKYGNVGLKLGTTSNGYCYYWSSTEESDWEAWEIENDRLYSTSKDDSRFVRAFMRL